MAAGTHETVHLAQQSGFQFEAQFGAGIAPLRTDLPPPAGSSAGPSPEQLLAASVGNCLAASLLFSLRKYKQEPAPIEVDVDLELGRNTDGRLRVKQIGVVLRLGQPAAALQHLERALAQFEGFCTVTQSVRGAIDVHVQVLDATGARLK
jgi:organic hydroperoxide reductase OsmC/OhrA